MPRVIPQCDQRDLRPKRLLLSLLGALGYLAVWPVASFAEMASVAATTPVLMGYQARLDDGLAQAALQPQEQQAIDAFLHEALRATRSLADPQDQLYPLIQIANTYQVLGDRKMALTLLETAVPMAQTTDAVYGYVEIAKIYIDADEPQRALPLLEDALRHGINSKSDNNYYLLSNIAAVGSRLSDRQLASGLMLSILGVVPELSGQQLRLVGDIVAAVEDWPGDLEGGAAAAEVILLASQTVEKLIATQTQGTFWVSSAALDVLQQMAITTGIFTDRALAIPVLERLTAVIDTLPESGERAQGLATLAAAYDQVGQPQVAGELLKTAVTVAMETSQVSSQAQALATIAAIADQLGYTQQSVEALDLAMGRIASHIEQGQTDSYGRALEVSIAVAAQLNDPQQAVASLENAIALIDKITWPYTKSQMLQTMVSSVGEWDHNQHTTKLMPVILASAQSLAAAESPSDLGQTITQGMVPPNKFYDGPPLTSPGLEYGFAAVISEVVTLAVQLENSQESHIVLVQALQAVIEAKAYGVDSLSKIAAATTALTNADHALSILEQVLVAVEPAAATARASTYIAVADVYGELGYGSRSQEVLMLAMAAIEQISDAWERYTQLANVPGRAVALDDADITQQLLQQVVAQIETLENEDHRASLLGYLSTALQSLPQEKQILEQAYPILDGLSAPASKVKGLVEIATAYARPTATQSDLDPRALDLLEQAIALLSELKEIDPYRVSRRLRDIFTVYRKLGAYDQGQAFLAQLASQSREITPNSSRDRAIEEVRLQWMLLEGAVLLDSPQQLKTALDTLHQIATIWPLDWTRDHLAQLPEDARWDYGETPEEQLGVCKKITSH